MVDKVRFGEFIREVSIRQRTISYNDVYAISRKKPREAKLRSLDIYRLLQPYISSKFLEQMKAVLPLAIYLVVFQILVLREQVSDPMVISAGLVAVMLGLMMFMEGLKRGLMPFGESIGKTLPVKTSLPVVMIIAMLLGIGVTFAEPAIGALKAAGAIVSVEKAPYLYSMLTEWSEVLVLVVGAGVGFAAVLGTMRLLYGWSLKPLIVATLTPTLLITVYMMMQPDLANTIGLAWDCGAVTTGPVTVPLILSLGIGIAAAAGKGNSPLSGFGIVTLASLFPILGVMLLTLYVSFVTTPEQIMAAAALASSAAASESPWYAISPGQEVIGGVRAIVPLVIFLLIVLKFVLREQIQHKLITAYGITLCVLGMIIFSLGLTYGLSMLGSQSGSLVPAAFTAIETVLDSPLYAYGLGLAIAVMFAWLLGFGSTLAEPALNALGATVQELTNGAFKKSMLIYAVSVGVGCGIALGLLKIAFGLSLGYFLLPGYIIAVVLTLLSSEDFVNIAWDSAGVTTGPVTVPLVLAMGLGMGDAVDAIEGFGILSLASIGPIISVLTVGLWIRHMVSKHHDQADASIEMTEK